MGCALFPIHSKLTILIVIFLIFLTLGAYFGHDFALFFLSGYQFGYFFLWDLLFLSKRKQRKYHLPRRTIYLMDSEDTSKKNNQEFTEVPQKLFLPKSDCKKEVGGLAYWELHGKKPVDTSNPAEAQSPDEISLNLCKEGKLGTLGTSLSKLSTLLSLLEYDHFGIHIITKKDLLHLHMLLHEDNVKYFAETFGIIHPRAVCIGGYGFLGFLVDNHGYMLLYDEMSNDMKYMGPNVIEGLINYFFYPDKVYELMENTCELIITEELKRQIKEGICEY